MLSIQFLVTALVVVVAPGTGVIYTLAVGLGRGRQAAVAAALGCTLGIESPRLEIGPRRDVVSAKFGFVGREEGCGLARRIAGFGSHDCCMTFYLNRFRAAHAGSPGGSGVHDRSITPRLRAGDGGRDDAQRLVPKDGRPRRWCRSVDRRSERKVLNNHKQEQSAMDGDRAQGSVAGRSTAGARRLAGRDWKSRAQNQVRSSTTSMRPAGSIIGT